MKYIRTKDKILLFRDYEDIDSVLTNIGWIHKTEIVKQADTIEELCDELVHITNIGNHILGHFWSPDSSDIVYGAIWTDKGLKYVAKMNEKGELI